MKDLNLLIWMTQLGLSVAMPLVCFTGISVWLRNRYELGAWVIFIGIVLGLFYAADGFRTSMKMMERMERFGKNKENRNNEKK